MTTPIEALRNLHKVIWDWRTSDKPLDRGALTNADENARAVLATRDARQQEPVEALDLAILFHHTYERLAPSVGYDTRVETRVFDPKSPNGKLMLSVCAELLQKLAIGWKEPTP